MASRRKGSSLLWKAVTLPLGLGLIVVKGTALLGLVAGAAVYHGVKAARRSAQYDKLSKERAMLYARLSEADRIKFDLAEVKRKIDGL